MQIFLKQISLEKIKNNLKISFKNFPISFISVILISGILEFLVLKQNSVPDSYENFLLKLVLSLVLVFLLGIGTRLFLKEQSCGIDKKIKCFIGKNLIKFSPIILGIVFFFNFEENLFNNFFFEEFIYIFVTILGASSFIFFSKFIKSRDGNDKYFAFFIEKIKKIGLSVFSGISLMLLGLIAFWSIFALFDLSNILNEGKIFGTWVTFSLSFFAPIYFLYFVGKNKISEKFELKSGSKFYDFFIKFLALPAIIGYFIILYAYSAKVLLNFQNWPEGIISWLIIFFSLFGYLIYILSFSLDFRFCGGCSGGLVSNFRRYFPFAVLFQLPMFFYAIYLRINQYDFTINRYLLLAFGFYLLAISIYFIFSERKKIMHIFSFLFGFILLISLSGSFSVYKFPENRQLDLLENSLVQSGILKEIDGKYEVFLPDNENDISKKSAVEIFHKVDYLCEFHGCDVLGKLMPGLLEEIKNEDKKNWEERRQEEIDRFSKAIEEHGDEVERTEINKRNLKREKYSKYTGINSWVYKDKITEKLKVQNYYYKDFNEAEFINVNIDYNLINDIYDVKGWDLMFRISNNYDLDYYLKDLKKEGFNEFYYTKYNSENSDLVIFKGEKEIEKINFSKDFEKFYKENKNNIKDWGYISIEKPFVIQKTGDSFEMKFLLNSFQLKNLEFDGVKNDDKNFERGLEGMVLIKEKK